MKRYEYRVKKLYYGDTIPEWILENAINELGRDGFRFVQLLSQKSNFNDSSTTFNVVVEREFDDDPPLTKKDFFEPPMSIDASIKTFGTFVAPNTGGLPISADILDKFRDPIRQDDDQPEDEPLDRKIIIES